MSKLSKEQIQNTHPSKEEVRLEDILNSIRGMIDDHKLDYDEEDTDSAKHEHEVSLDNKKRQAEGIDSLNNKDEILELHEVVNTQHILEKDKGEAVTSNKYASSKSENLHHNNNNASEILSGQARMKSAQLLNEFANQAKAAKLNHSNEELDNLVYKLIKPMLKDWLDNNLPQLVEKIIQQELKKLIPEK